MYVAGATATPTTLRAYPAPRPSHFALLLYSFQRRGDVIRMGRQHVNHGELTVVQRKTKAKLTIPVHPDLQRIIDATPSGNLTFLCTSHGHPFTDAGFGNWFREVPVPRLDSRSTVQPMAYEGSMPAWGRGRVDRAPDRSLVRTPDP